MENVWLHRFSVLLAVCTLFLVVAGASVVSNDAGLSVPDWPLSYGKVMPEMRGGVFFEHGHRMVGATVGFLTIILAFWLWRVERRTWLKRLGVVALFAVCLQGVLGGLTVLYMLPRPVSITHACLAQLFFSTTVAMALFTSPAWKRGPEPVTDSGTPSLRMLGIVAPATVLAQLALGAAYRHKAIDLIPHVAGALVVTGVVLYVAIVILTQYGTHRPLTHAAFALIGIETLQVFLGIAAYMSRISTSEAVEPSPFMVAFTVLHVATGALTMAASVVLAIQVFRNVGPAAVLASRGAAVTS